MTFQDYTDEKFELIELVNFFYKKYKDQPLNWFDSVFSEFEKLKEKMDEKGRKS